MKNLSAFSYFGGKLSKLDFILPQLATPHRTYVESCAGSAAVLLNKSRVKNEILNDSAEEVADFWKAMRECPDELQRLIECSPSGGVEFKRILSAPPTDNLAERARRFYMRVTQAFSNMPSSKTYSMTQSLLRFRHDRLKSSVDRLRGVCVENVDSVRLIKRVIGMNHSGVLSPVLFYADPPYTADSRDGAGEYIHDDFNHEEFLDAVLDAPSFCKFAISGYPNKLYDNRLADWHRVELDVNRSATRSRGRARRTEVLWRNYPIATTSNLFN